MKHVLLLLFLILFNVWYISSNVSALANNKTDSPESSASGLSEIVEPTATISQQERLPYITSQSSETVTPLKAVGTEDGTKGSETSATRLNSEINDQTHVTGISSEAVTPLKSVLTGDGAKGSETTATRLNSESDQTHVTGDYKSNANDIQKTSTEEVTEPVTQATSENKAKAESESDHVKTSNAWTEVTTQTSLLHFQDTTAVSRTQNEKPSKPDSLVMFDCDSDFLCLQWKQSGIFDSYVISVNGSEANVSCTNSSDATDSKPFVTVHCTVYHVVPFGSSVWLSVHVKSGSQKSHEVQEAYNKNPATPVGLHVMIANTSAVCFFWNQTGVYDNFNIEISLFNHSFHENRTIPKSDVTHMTSDGLMLNWCIDDLPCPGAAYSLQIGAISQGKRSNFSSLTTFRSAIESQVRCGSQTNESIGLFISPDIRNYSCPSLEDNIYFEFIYCPVNDESCSNSMKSNSPSNTSNMTNFNVMGLIAGTTYQVKVRTIINKYQPICCTEPVTINCTTAPADPGEIELLEIGMQSVNVSWLQKGVADNFSISVSDPSARIFWNFTRNGTMHVWSFIDQLSTPGQRLTITVTALSGQLKSNSQQRSFNTKPQKPYSLVMFDCDNNILCLQWKQSGIFDSYVIRVNGSGTNFSCHNSSDANSSNSKNFVTVKCTVYYIIVSGSSTLLSVHVKSGSRESDEVQEVYIKKPSKPDSLVMFDCDSDFLCLQWKQSGIFDSYVISVNGSEANVSCTNSFDATDSKPFVTVDCIVYHVVPFGSSVWLSVHVESGSQKSHEVQEAYNKNPATPVGLRVVMANTSTVCFFWNQTGFYDNFNIEISLFNHSYKKNLTIPKSDVTNMTSDSLMLKWCIDGLPCPGAAYSLLFAAVSQGKRSNFSSLTTFRQAIESQVRCGSQTNESISLSISPDIKSYSCPSLKDNIYFEFIYCPVNDESCSNSMKSDSQSNTTNMTNFNVMGLIAGTTYQVKVWTIINKYQPICCTEPVTINCTTVPADPGEIKCLEIDMQSVNVSWLQRGVADNFSISVSDPSARIFLNFSNKGTGHMWSFIDQLSKPGQHLTITITALSGQLKSNSQQRSFNTKPQKPDSLVIFDCENDILCLQWKQSGIFDSYVIRVNGSGTNFLCHNLSDSNSSDSKNFVTVKCTVYYIVPSGSSTLLSVKVTSGSRESDEVQEEYIKKPSKPIGLRVVTANTSSVCFSWNQTGFYDNFNIEISLFNHSFQENLTIPKSDVTNMTSDGLTLMWCIDGLPCPGAVYSLLFAAVSQGKRSNFSSLTTFDSVPEPPSKVTIERTFVDSLQLSVQYNRTEHHCTHFLFSVTSEKNETGNCSTPAHNLTKLDSNTCYNISVYTVSNHSGYGLKSQTSAGVIVSNWTLPQAVSKLHAPERTASSLTLQWTQRDYRGNDIWYHLMLQNSSEYREIPLDCSSTVLNCTNKVMTYKLKNLSPSTNYTITIQAVNPGGVSEKQVITEQTLTDALDKALILLVGIVVCVALTFLVIVVLLVILRKKTKFAVPSARRPSDGLGFRNPTYTSDDICEGMKPKPIPLDGFIKHLENLHEDSDCRFSDEYAMLTELSPKLPQNAAELEENRTKNRYSNILPFDHSRVKLIPLDDDDQGSDYINASYMPGYVSKREFIAAQGPMKSTVDDFWRMIWEQHVNTIVMVTNLQERGREKCAEYWPTDEEPVFYGDLQVQMKSESQLNYYIIRILDVKLGEKKRVVKHLHFISWPDFGCPENTAVLLDFVLGVRAHAPIQPLQGSGPILVHCSAGVGRTGTFIVVDHLLQRMQKHDTLDIFGLVLEMRNYRCNMLQTEAQYVFAHECIKTAIERQMISSVRNSTGEDEDEECMYQNVSRKEESKEEEECVYQNCPKNNLERPSV